MATKKKGLFARIIEGPERSEEYARSTLPSNRWALGWDLIKTNFGKLIKINLLTLLFVFPVFLLLVLRYVIISGQASLAPFSQNLGIGYPIFPNMNGLEEQIVLRTDVIFFIALFVLTFYISVGIAGGFYVMRNLVWTEGVFVASDFWAGVRKNYKNVLACSLIFVLVLAISILTIDTANYQIALRQGNEFFLTISKIMSFVFMFFFAIVYLYSLSMGVTYTLSVAKLLRNSLICGIGVIPLNVFFGAFSLLGFGLLLTDPTSIFFSFGIMLILFFAISFMMLVWTNFTQWVFDEFVNDKVAGAKKNRGIYKKNAIAETEEYVYTKSVLTSRPIKPITDYDIEISGLSEGYTRKDLERLEESKKAMMEDSDRYAEEHSKDKVESKTSIDEFMADDSGDKNGKK